MGAKTDGIHFAAIQTTLYLLVPRIVDILYALGLHE